MRIPRKALFSVALASAAFLAGLSLRRPGGTRSEQRTGQPLYYHDPMHPAYMSDKPGIAPDCGMQLEPVYAEDDSPAKSGALPPGAARISFERQQIMGLQTLQVSRTSGLHILRALGRVAPDQSRTYKISALADGVVRMVSSYSPGNIARKDDLLASYFVPARELYNALQSFFVAMSNLDRGMSLRADPSVMDTSKSDVRLAEELLKSYGVTEAQLMDLSRTRQATRDIQFRSPVTGLVLNRSAELGQRIDRGAGLYRIADISHVWVLADLFGNDSNLILTGSAARVRYGGRNYRASVSDSRQFDPASRTLKIRLVLDNPGLVLRPDMFVDVEFEVQEPEGISVPVDAVLDSGRRKTVFVAVGDGVFQPREVITGSRYGDRVQVVKGLKEGESVVVSGLFLLDSESRLQTAAARAAAPQTSVSPAAGGIIDPVCGMDVGASKTGYRSNYRGSTYTFCSKTCKDRFDGNPDQYAAKKKVETAEADRP